MRQFIFVTLVGILWTLGPIGPNRATAQLLSDQLRAILYNRFEAVGVPSQIRVGEAHIPTSSALRHFYKQRIYQAAWIGSEGPFPSVNTLIAAIRAADRDGLRPNDYHLTEIEATLVEVHHQREAQGMPNPNQLANLDILLSDAFLTYGSHLLTGRANPEAVKAQWLTTHREADLAAVLERAVQKNTVMQALASLRPPYPGYIRLQHALMHYRDIAARGGWPTVPVGPKLQQGDQDKRVAALRSRLIVTSDLVTSDLVTRDLVTSDLGPAPPTNATLFDQAVKQAVQRFQRRHGLVVDGIVGPATVAALNVPVEDRIRQIQLNLERWRWLPQHLGQRYILVNIPNFTLNVVENGRSVKTMRVVVGKARQRTPVFSSLMTYLVFNPYWHIPRSIVRQEILPAIRRDADYLTTQHIKIVQGWGADTQEIDPTTLDWATISAHTFPYRLRQEPGPKNALGRVKFVFPNSFNVYFHDTPHQEFFARAVRNFSHGCIRVEKPLELAELILQEDSTWTQEKIQAILDTRAARVIWLQKPLPVHLLYWTAWVEEAGAIQFRTDFYGRDKLLEKALRDVLTPFPRKSLPLQTVTDTQPTLARPS